MRIRDDIGYGFLISVTVVLIFLAVIAGIGFYNLIMWLG